MDPHIQALVDTPSFQTTEDVRSMPSAQQPATTWQEREVTGEQRQQDPTAEGLSHGRIMTRILSFLPQPDILCRIYRGCVHVFRTCFGRSTEPCIHAEILSEQRQQDPVTEGLSSAHIMAQVLSFVPSADMSRSALACHSFRAAKTLVDLEQARSLALTFGFPKEFSFSVEGSPCRPLDESDPIIARLIQIEQTLPEALRKNNSREVLRTLAQNPTWLRGFLQTAYDNQLLLAFGEAAGIDPAQPFAQQVRHVRQWLATSPQVLHLNLEGKNLLILPEEVAQLTNLHCLDVSNNQLTALPDLSPLTRLGRLYVYKNQIVELPDLSSLTDLQIFNASGNLLARLPNLSSSTNLVALLISRNQLSGLPDLSSLTKLQILDVSGNQLTKLPDLRPLINLENLYAYQNRLTELPDLSSLTKLEELSVSENLLTALPNLSSLASLRRLYAEQNLLTTLPDLSLLANLRTLYVSGNQLTELPDLRSLTNLGHLYVGTNRLTTFPDLRHLTNLENLDVSQNQLTELPNLSSLIKIRILNAGENQLTRLPDLSPLANLEQLYVSQNQLTELPDLHSLVNLQILYVHNTQITRLPDALFQLPQIRILFARENPHLAIPEEQQPLIKAFYARGGRLFR